MLWTSTIGASPVTVMVSSTVPTRSSAFTAATNDPVSSMPSRRTLEKPVSEKFTVYVPGRKSTIRYCPDESVTAVRTFSIRTGLDASTTTPGSTAPDASLTTPVMVACAWAEAGRTSTERATNNNHRRTRILELLVAERRVRFRGTRPTVVEALCDIQAQHLPRVAFVDLLALTIRDLQPVDVLDRLADVERALLGVERKIAGKEHVIESEEGQAQLDSRPVAKQSRIREEHLVVVERALLQALQVSGQVFVFGARAELIQARPDSPGEIGNHSSGVMRDDPEV